MDYQELHMREAAQRRYAAQLQAMGQRQSMGLQGIGQYEALGRQAMGQQQSFTMGYGYMIQQPGTIGSTGQAVYGSPRGLENASAQRPVVKFKKRYRFHSYYSKVKEQIENTKRSVI